MIKQDLPWFRFYKEAIDDAKLKLIAYEDRWHFVALLCCKAQGLLEIDTPLARRKICIKLGLDSRELEEVIRRLAEVELVDAKTMEPLAWDKRQFLSDSSAERVKRHRAKRAEQGLPQQNYIPAKLRTSVFERDGCACIYCGSAEDLTIDHKTPQSRGGGDDEDNLATACRACNASKRDLTHAEFIARKSGSVTVTPHIQITDTDKDKEQKNTYPDDFENVWQVYPNRPGRSKAAAYKAWKARIKAGDTPEAMTTGVIAYAAYCNALATDPQYIRQPETFFGPSRHFASDWTVQQAQSKGSSLNLLPANSPRIREIRADNQDEWPDWMRDDVEVAHAG